MNKNIRCPNCNTMFQPRNILQPKNIFEQKKSPQKDQKLQKTTNDVSYDYAINCVINFGKYKGKSLGEIPIDYILWLSENTTNTYIKIRASILIDNGHDPEIFKKEVSKSPSDNEWIGASELDTPF